MRREDVKAKFPNMTDDDIQWLMDEHGKGITREKNIAAQLQTQLDTANERLKGFEGVDVAQLQGEITKLRNDMAAQADAFAFDSELDGAIRAANGRNIKAIRGMLDIESLRSSKNRGEDIKTALDALGKSDPWAFGVAAPPSAGNVTVTTGGGHGQGGKSEGEDGVIARFKSLNPELKI